jgi:hypothetical protein
VYFHLLSSTEGKFALTIHGAPQGSPTSEYLMLVDDQWWGYPEELYFEFDVKSVSEDNVLLDLLVDHLDWWDAKQVLQEVGQYREANKGIDLMCTLQCALFDLHLVRGLLDSYSS